MTKNEKFQESLEQRAFKGIWIPKEIWINSKLSITEKILISEIDSFDKTIKGCYASNSYFGSFLGLSPSRVSGIISKLIKMNYIISKLTYHPLSKEIDKRYLKINWEIIRSEFGDLY